MDVIRRAWHAWKRFGQAIGDFLARIVLTIFYFTVFAPFGLGVRLFADPLQMKRKTATGRHRQSRQATLEGARRLS